MKYTIELTKKQKATFECLLAITERFIGFNPKLEPITSDVAGYMTNEELKELQKAEYDVGWHNGYKQGRVDTNSDCYAEGYEKGKAEGYNRGLEDAENAIDRLMDFTVAELEKEFGTKLVTDVWLENSLQDIIAITKAYEEKKKAEIKVGDEVIVNGDKAIVTRINPNDYDVFYDDGITGTPIKENCEKTGKHYDIESILKELGE